MNTPKKQKIYYNLNLVNSNNSSAIDTYKKALEYAMAEMLTPKENQILKMHFIQGKSKSQVAKEYGTSCSAVCKSIKKSITKIRWYTDLYMKIYREIESQDQEYA